MSKYYNLDTSAEVGTGKIVYVDQTGGGDTDSLEDAINNFPDATRVIVRQGTYVINNPLTVSKDIVGDRGVTFQAANPNDYMFIITGGFLRQNFSMTGISNGQDLILDETNGVSRYANIDGGFSNSIMIVKINGNDLTFEQLSKQFAGAMFILLGTVLNVVIRDCKSTFTSNTMQFAQGNGIGMNVTIHDCRFDTFGARQIRSFAGTTNLSKITTIGCNFTDLSSAVSIEGDMTYSSVGDSFTACTNSIISGSSDATINIVGSKLAFASITRTAGDTWGGFWQEESDGAFSILSNNQTNPIEVKHGETRTVIVGEMPTIEANTPLNLIFGNDSILRSGSSGNVAIGNQQIVDGDDNVLVGRSINTTGGRTGAIVLGRFGVAQKNFTFRAGSNTVPVEEMTYVESAGVVREVANLDGPQTITNKYLDGGVVTINTNSLWRLPNGDGSAGDWNFYQLTIGAIGFDTNLNRVVASISGVMTPLGLGEVNTQGAPVEIDNIVTYFDTTGNNIKDSGVSIEDLNNYTFFRSNN